MATSSFYWRRKAPHIQISEYSNVWVEPPMHRKSAGRPPHEIFHPDRDLNPRGEGQSGHKSTIKTSRPRAPQIIFVKFNPVIVLALQGSFMVLSKCVKFQSKSFDSKGEKMNYYIYLNIWEDVELDDGQV